MVEKLGQITLDADQESEAVRIAYEPTGAALNAGTMSSGKTVVSLRVAQLRGAQSILIIAPLNTRLGWKVTAERMGIDLPFHWLQNSKTGQDAFTSLAFDEPGIYFIGPTLAVSFAWDKAGHKVTYKQDGTPVKKVVKKRNNFWDAYNTDLLIVDEIHQGTSNSRSQTYKTFMQLRAGFKLGLSGTPHGNFFEGIYPVTHFLWPDNTPKTAAIFKDKYCATKFDPFAWDKKKVTGELNEGAYFASLPCVVRREWKYEGTIDEDVRYVELSAAQRKAYRELEQNMVTYLKDNPLVIEFPPTLRIRLRQATLGLFNVTDDNEVVFDMDCKSTKLDALSEILADDFQDEPALIFTDSKRFAKVIAHRIPGTEEWSGDYSSTKRDEIKERFQSGATKYIVMVIKSGGTGTDGLQYAARNVAWVSVDDSRIQNEQADARVVRRGQGDLVRVRHIVAVDTYDLGILSSQAEAALSMNKSMKLTQV